MARMTIVCLALLFAAVLLSGTQTPAQTRETAPAPGAAQTNVGAPPDSGLPGSICRPDLPTQRSIVLRSLQHAQTAFLRARSEESMLRLMQRMLTLERFQSALPVSHGDAFVVRGQSA